MENAQSDMLLLVKKAVDRDHSAFAMLVTRFRQKIYRLLYHMVRHEEDAWDLLQDTFLKAYQQLPRLRKPELFSTWLIKIAMNIAINHLKKKKRQNHHREKMANEMRHHPGVEAPDQIAERREMEQKLHALIAKLPAKQRSVLVLCDLEGYSYKEAAQILQCRIGTIMSRLYYARNFLRSRFQISEIKIPAEVDRLWGEENSDFLVTGRQ